MLERLLFSRFPEGAGAGAAGRDEQSEEGEELQWFHQRLPFRLTGRFLHGAIPRRRVSVQGPTNPTSMDS